MYKFYHKKIPKSFGNFFHEMSQTHSYNTRQVQSQSFFLSRLTKKKTQKSFKFAGVKIWKNIPTEIQQSNSLNLFSKKCKTYLISPENKMEASILPEIPDTEVRKSWFAEPETSPNGSPTVRVAVQEPKTVT